MFPSGVVSMSCHFFFFELKSFQFHTHARNACAHEVILIFSIQNHTVKL